MAWNFSNTSSIYSNLTDYEYEIEGEENLIFFTILWPLISIIGILANLCVIIVLPTKNQSPTEYFCINLAISDMLFLVVCPTLSLINLHKLIIYENLPIILANIICKADFFLSHLTVFITCLTLVSMSFAIMYPLSSLGFRSKKKAILINVSIWLFSILLSVPHAYLRVIVKEEITYCSSSELSERILDLVFFQMNVGQLQILFTIFVAYIVPFISIFVCYLFMIFKLIKKKKALYFSRYPKEFIYRKKRILVMIALVTILFGITWLPIHCFLFAMKFSKNFPYENNTLFVIKNIAHTLTYLNSMLNPFFYTIMGNSFKIKFISRLSKYSPYKKSSCVKTNPTFRESVFLKRLSQNDGLEHHNSSVYKYKSINQRRET